MQHRGSICLPKRTHRAVGLLALLIVTIGGLRVSGQTAKPQAADLAPIQFEEETLPNGLRVIYTPLRQAPVVHVRVLYHVGSRDERVDRQGFAHMFEHMMFRGSAHVKPEEHMKLIGIVGGNSNAYTSFDQTVYINTVPSNHLEMALYLEADRMASFKVNEDIYKTERKVVAEEWRIRQNRPYGNFFELFMAKAFTKHPYQWTPIGNMDHLKAARVNELQEFFNRYYLPNNAVLVIAGDYKTDEAKQLVRKYFGWIPKGPDPKREIPVEPPQTEARTAEESQGVPLPMLMIGYHLPAYESDDHYALAALNTILGAGDSSRLDRLLVHGKEPMCVRTQAMHWQGQDSGMFGMGGVVMAGKESDKVKTILFEALADIVKNGVTTEELDKAKTILRTAIVKGRETADELAAQLGDEALLAHRAARVNEAPQKIAALTVDEIKRVAGKYLEPQNSTTLLIKPSLMAAIAKTDAKKADAVKDAPVQPATAPVQARVVDFPTDYPTKPPMAQPRSNPEFAKGTETEINGVKVIVMPDHRLPLTSWSLTMRRGSHSDPKGKDGLASITGDMLRRGAGKMTFEELNSDLDSRGISMDVRDGGDFTRLSSSSPSDQLQHSIQRGREILLTPTFPEDEFKKLKQQTIESLVLSLDQPSVVAGQDLAAALYGDSPLGRSPIPASVKSITLDDVKGFYETYFRPNDAILVLSGDVTVEQGQSLARTLLGGWEKSSLSEVAYQPAKAPGKRKILLVDRPAGKQSVVRIGLPAYTIASDDKFPGSVAGQILTAGIDSRLGRYVRAEKGLAYGVHGVFQPGRHGGTFVAGTDTALESTADAIEAIFKVLGDMRAVPVTPTELAEAQQRVAGGMVMGMQTITQQAGYRVDGILNNYPIDYYDVYPHRIAQVTDKQIQDVMQKYVKDGEVTIVVVAPAESVKVQLQRLGDVETVPMPAQRDRAGVPQL